MFNYRIKRISAYSVFKYVTVVSLIWGGIWGLLISVFAHDVFGLWGGFFIGFVFGLVNGIFAYIYTFLFNLFASSIGGIEIQLERKDAFLDTLQQPIPLQSNAAADTEQQPEVPSSENTAQ